MDKNEVRSHSRRLLLELMQLDALATSQIQRRRFKEAREYLQRAIETGSSTAIQLGSYHLAIVSAHIREVQEGKRKGLERAKRRKRLDNDTAEE